MGNRSDRGFVRVKCWYPTSVLRFFFVVVVVGGGVLDDMTMMMMRVWCFNKVGLVSIYTTRASLDIQKLSVFVLFSSPLFPF